MVAKRGGNMLSKVKNSLAMCSLGYGNRANVYSHVAVVHEHVLRTLCSVCATGARVAQPVPCNS